MAKSNKLKPDHIQDFGENGYVVIDGDEAPLTKLRDVVFSEACDLLDLTEADAETFFNNFHKRKLNAGVLNDFRISLIKNVNEKVDVPGLIYESIRKPLSSLFGPDVATQKKANIVIHQPGDVNIPPVHRDSPPFSNFEVVAWVPLVHCFGTKAVPLLDRKKSAEGLELLFNPEDGGPEKLSEYFASEGVSLDTDFGNVVVFWAGLLHGVPVNGEKETRWSFNVRYKNLFSPYGDGSTGFTEDFRILEMSPLSRIGVDEERKLLGKGSS